MADINNCDGSNFLRSACDAGTGGAGGGGSEFNAALTNGDGIGILSYDGSLAKTITVNSSVVRNTSDQLIAGGLTIEKLICNGPITGHEGQLSKLDVTGTLGLVASGSGKFGGGIMGEKSNDDDMLHSSAFYARSANPSISLLDTGGTKGVMLAAKNGGDFGISTLNENGTELAQNFNFTTQGYLGIGTDTPSGKLEIWQNSPTAPVLRLEDVGAASYDWTFPDANKVKFSTNTVSTKDFILNNEGSGGMNLIVQSGNVGIGTSSPGAKLEVAGSNPSIKVKADADGEDSHLILHDHEGNGWTIYNEGANTSGAGVDSLLFRDDTNNATAMSIRAGGNVGIGTTSPINKLSINGNASAHAYEFYQNTTSSASECIHKPASGEVAIRANSQERLRIDGSGNVGIGTSAPGSPLSIKSSAALGIQFDRDAVNIGQISMHEDNLNVDANTNNLVFQTPASKYHIFSGGNVGIGTETPGYKLVVQADPAVSNDGMRITDENGSGRAMLYTAGAGHGALQLINDSNLPKVVIGSNENSYFNGGNVGIGTDAPAAKLEIVTSVDHLNLKVDDIISQSVIQFSDSVGVQGGINLDHDTNKLHFTRGGSGPADTKMVIDATGNVGIGTSSPSGMLDIKTSGTDAYPLQVESKHPNQTAIRLRNTFVNFGDSRDIINWELLTFSSADPTNPGHFAIGTGQADIKLVISPDGNVGIGTSSPSGKLDIIGPISDASLEPGSDATANFRTTGHVQLAINSQLAAPYTTSLQAKHGSLDEGASYPIALNPLGGTVGIGTATPKDNADLTIGNSGYLCLAEALTTPNSDAGFGKIYTKSNNNLYFQDGAGTEKTVSFSAGASWSSAPATATSAGAAGDRAYDPNYYYVCVATNTWKRTALATW